MKKILISMMMAAASLGMMAQADAASGYVNVEDVLSSTPAFMQAGKTVVSEQQKLQNQFNEQSKNMSDKDKQALGLVLQKNGKLFCYHRFIYYLTIYDLPCTIWRFTICGCR